MIISDFTETSSLNLKKDIIRRIVIYTNLFLTFYIGKNEAESDRLIGDPLFNFLSISSIIVSLIHYRQMYKITDLNYSHQKEELIVSHGGQVTSILVMIINFIRLAIFGFFEKHSDGRLTGEELTLIMFNILGVYICYSNNLTFDYRRGIFWDRILTINHRFEYFAILIIFLGVSFFMPEQLIESTFKLCLIGIVLFAFRKIKDKGVHKDLDAEFLDKVSNLYYIYFAIAVVTYFNLQDILSNGIEAISEIYEKKIQYYYVPLFLGILCIRYKFYLRLKLVILHATFNNFPRDMPPEEIFQFEPVMVITRAKSYTVQYFIDNLTSIMDISHSSIFRRNYSFKKSFLSKIMAESTAIRERMQLKQLKMLKIHEEDELENGEKKVKKKNTWEEKEEIEEEKENEKKGKIFNKLKKKKFFSFFSAIYMKCFVTIFENFEFFFRFTLQILCIVYVYQKTNIDYPNDTKTFMRVVNFPIIMVITFWNIFTCKVYDKFYLKNFSIFVVIPTLFLQEALNVYFYIVNKERDRSTFEKIEDILISLFTIHTFLLIYSIKNNKMKNVFMMKIEIMVKRFKQDLKSRNKNLEAFSYLIQTFVKSYGHYLICSFGIAGAMFEASVLDIILIVLSLNFITKKTLNQSMWFKYIMYIDFLILAKVAVTNIPKAGVLLNSEFMSMMGLTFYPRASNAVQITLFIIQSLVASYFLVMLNKGEKVEINFNLNLKKRHKKVKYFKYFIMTINFISEFFPLFFHSGLALLLIFDTKDGSTLIVFITEMITIPIHLYLYIKRKNNDTEFHRKILKSYKPLFCVCLIFCFVRYLVFFLRYNFIKYYADKFLFKLFTEEGKLIENRNIFYHLFFHLNKKFTDQGKVTHLIDEYTTEFFVLVLSIFTFVSIRQNYDRAKSSDKTLLGMGLLGAVTNIEGVDDEIKKKMMIYSKEEKKITKRTFKFLIFTLLGQSSIVVLSTTALTTYPNFYKCVIMGLFMLYVLTSFSQLRKVFVRYKIIPKLSKQIKYFGMNFVLDIGKTKKYTFEVTEEIEEVEKIQNKLYFNRIMYEYEKSFEHLDNRFWWMLTMPLIIGNTISLLMFIIVKIYFWKEQSFSKSKLEENFRFFNIWLGYYATDVKTLETDMYYSQILISMLMMMFGISRTYYIKKGSRLSPIPDSLTRKLIDCMEARVDVYSYKPPKFGISEMRGKCETYMERFKDFLESYEEYFGEKLIVRIKNLKKKDNGEVTSSSSEMSFNTDSEQVEDSSDSETKPKEKSEKVIYQLSELTKIKEKVVFIHLNKNKYYLSLTLMAFLVNAERLSLMWIIINVIRSASFFNIFLLALCFTLAKTKAKAFMDQRNLHLFVFCVYFIFNWMFFRNDQLLAGSTEEKNLYDKIRLFCGLGGKGSSKSRPNSTLLGCFVVVSLGYAMALFTLKFVYTRLFVIKRKKKNTFHSTTVDGYLIISYKAWKRTNFNFMNIAFKLSHTMIVELYASIIFFMCIFIKDSGIFVTLILYSTFCVALVESAKSIRIMENIGGQNLGGHKTVMKLSVSWMKNLIWFMISCSQLSNITNFNHFLIPETIPWIGVVILYIVISIKDLMNSDEFYKTRQKLKAESNLKTKFSALGYAYKHNEEKIFDRISAFIGKRKLNEMSKQMVMTRLDKARIYMDYNKPHVRYNLNEIYHNLQSKYFKGLRAIKHKVVYGIYDFFHSNTNHFRSMDMFVLYQLITNMNEKILKFDKTLDLKHYFNSNFRQFEKCHKETKYFYDMYRERDEKKLAQYDKNMGDLIYELNMGDEKIEEIKTVKDLNRYAWMKKRDKAVYEEDGEAVQKPRQGLKKCSNLLYGLIVRDQKAEGLAKFENVKLELQKTGYIMCKYGRLKVVIHSMNSDILNKTGGLNVFNLNLVVKMGITCISSNIELTAGVVTFIILSIFGGVFNVIILGIVIFGVLVEEIYGNSFWWKFIYLLSLLKLVLKTTLQNDNPHAIQLLFGSKKLWPDILLMVILNTVLYIQKKIGFANSNILKIESPGSAIVRLVVNRKLQTLTDRITEKKQKALEGLSLYLQKTFKNKIGDENYAALKIECTRSIVKSYLQIENSRSEILETGQLLAQRMRDDIFKCTDDKVDDFFFRNFSCYSRKLGKNYQTYIYLTLTLIVFHIFIGVSTIDTGDFDFKAIFTKGQKISSQVVITLLIYVVMIVLEKFFYSFNNSDLIGIRKDPLITDFWREILDSKPYLLEKKPLTLKEKWRIKVRAMIVALRMAKLHSKKDKEHMKSNMFVKYIYLILLWIILHADCFFVMPILNLKEKNRLLYSQGLNHAFLCDAETTNKNAAECYSYLTLVQAKIFYGLNCVFFLLSILQIRKGIMMRIPDHVDYKKIKNKLRYYLYYMIPGIREINTFIEYAAEKTTLSFTEWLLCDDMKKLMVKSQMAHNVNNSKNSGILFARKKRIMVSMGCLVALGSILLLPMMIFSDVSIGTTVYEMNSGKITMDLYVEGNKKLLNLFKTDLLLENRKLQPKEKIQIERLPNFGKLNTKLMRVIKFGSYSQRYLDLESNGRKYIAKKLKDNIGSPLNIKIGIQFQTPLDKKEIRVYEREWVVKIPNDLVKNVINVLSSGCTRHKVTTKKSEFFLLMIPQLMKLRSIDQKIELFDDIPKYTQKFGLSLKCDKQEKKNYLWLMSNEDPSFYVSMVSKNDVYEILKKFVSKKKLKIRTMYIAIFSIVFVSMVRPLLANQTTKLRYQELPRNKVILIILDAMRYARLEDDLVKEQLLFCRLLDIMRDPEMVQQVTDNAVRYREENIYNRFN